MTVSRNAEERISLWLEEDAVRHFPDQLLKATYEQTRALRQERSSNWNIFPMLGSFGRFAAAGAAVVVLAAVAFWLYLNQPGIGDDPSSSPTASADVTASPSVEPVPTEPAAAANGWIAFSVEQSDPAGTGPDTDIWFAALDEDARRVIGSDTDDVDQLCPAFSPDGRSIAYGMVEGIHSPGNGSAWVDYRNSALVIADVGADGTVADRLTIDVGDELPPPCPLWSPDGDRLAFGVPRTSPINPDRSGEGSEVWVVRLSDRDVSVVPDLLATDLDWAPNGSLLAIAGGIETASGEGVKDGLQGQRIHLYELSTGTLRTLDDTLGVDSLTWEPDGGRIAYEVDGPAGGIQVLRIIDVEIGQQEPLTGWYPATHGVGPVWSPDGETIAYQRTHNSAERHEVVLVTPDERSAQTGLASQIAMPIERMTTDGSSLELFPWRVTWSPDGRYLLYVAWTSSGDNFEQVLVAVPTDQDAPAVLLADVPGIAAYEGYGDTMRVPIQLWGRR